MDPIVEGIAIGTGPLVVIGLYAMISRILRLPKRVQRLERNSRVEMLAVQTIFDVVIITLNALMEHDTTLNGVVKEALRRANAGREQVQKFLSDASVSQKAERSVEP